MRHLRLLALMFALLCGCVSMTHNSSVRVPDPEWACGNATVTTNRGLWVSSCFPKINSHSRKETWVTPCFKKPHLVRGDRVRVLRTEQRDDLTFLEIQYRRSKTRVFAYGWVWAEKAGKFAHVLPDSFKWETLRPVRVDSQPNIPKQSPEHCPT